MVVFGLILLLLGIGAGAFAIWVAMTGTNTQTPAGSAMAVDFLGNTLEVSILNLVLLGVGGVLLTLLGFWVMVAASRRKMRQNKERRELRKTQKRQEAELAETRARLAEDERRGSRPATHTETRETVRRDDHGIAEHAPRAQRHDDRIGDHAPRTEQTFEERTAPRYEETYRSDDRDGR